MEIRDVSYTMPWDLLTNIFGGGRVLQLEGHGLPLAGGHLESVQKHALKTGSQPVMDAMAWKMERNDGTLQSLQAFADEALKGFGPRPTHWRYR